METDIILNWPVDPAKYPLTQGFGENPQDYAVFKQAGHNGIDMGCPLGTPVCAAADGVVVHTGVDKNGYGKYVRVSHEKFETLYAHLSEIEVKPRQVLHAGDRLGLSGSTGNSSGPHLHFELRIPWEPIAGYPGGARDPMPFLEVISNQLSVISSAIKIDEKQSVIEIQPGEAVRVTATDGLIIRREPGGEALGAARCGDVFEAARAEDDWVGVVVYVHAAWLQSSSSPPSG